ncbi:MAG TPA: C13 family peptidase [Burkholderiales bacterium]
MIFRSLPRNLVAGARLALFLPVRPFDYRASPADYALLVVFNFVLWVAAAWVRAGYAGEFDPMAVPIYFGAVPLVLLAAFIAAAAASAPERLMLVATALTASDAVFEAIGLVLPGLTEGLGPVAGLALLAWIWIVALRAVAVAAGTRPWPFAQGALAVTAMVATGFLGYPRTDVWLASNDDAVVEPLAREDLFHAQGRLIERTLAAIRPGRPGRAEFYFVGFAPDASQDVFLREMRFVRTLFDERFGTTGRSIVLASSSDALEEFPIGSATNLKRALARVGEAMNADEDILFLLVSAHGDREHRLSASQPPLELAPLTPTALARMLQDAGIKWRVIVVSACYSGGYIEPLRDANTVVITAAAADRTSFGCEPGRDWTYFGQAYFRDALPFTGSITGAFEVAKKIVAGMESKENQPSSLPQIWIGPAIARRLEKMNMQPEK